MGEAGFIKGLFDGTKCILSMGREAADHIAGDSVSIRIFPCRPGRRAEVESVNHTCHADIGTVFLPKKSMWSDATIQGEQASGNRLAVISNAGDKTQAGNAGICAHPSALAQLLENIAFQLSDCLDVHQVLILYFDLENLFEEKDDLSDRDGIDTESIPQIRGVGWEGLIFLEFRVLKKAYQADHKGIQAGGIPGIEKGLIVMNDRFRITV